MLCHDLREVVVLSNPGNRDEVPFAGDCVDLGHAVHAGEVGAEVGETIALGLDEDECGEHAESSLSGPVQRFVTGGSGFKSPATTSFLIAVGKGTAKRFKWILSPSRFITVRLRQSL